MFVKKNILKNHLGNAAITIGGFQKESNKSDFEFYSPNAKCNFKQESNLTEQNLIFVIIGNSIVYCGNDVTFNCWQYNFYNDNFTLFAKSNNTHLTRTAKVYQNKLYIVGSLNAVIYDAENYKWSTWASPLNITGLFACSAIWKDTLLVLAKEDDNNHFQQYNFTSKIWNNLNNSEINFEWPTCLIVPRDQNKLLVAGYENRASIYDLIKEQWISVGNTSTYRKGGDLVGLGKRVFYLSGMNSTFQDMDTVEEFHLPNKSWTIVNQKMMMAKRLLKSLSIPAFLLQSQVENCTGVN